MAESSDTDTSRARVETYVPSYQREEWDKHADELGMSRSEFIRSMVQAGRSKFDPNVGEENGQSSNGENATQEGGDLESQVLAALQESGPLDWEDLLSAVTGDIERRLEETLSTLQSANRVQYSGRQGGYRLQEGPNDE